MDGKAAGNVLCLNTAAILEGSLQDLATAVKEKKSSRDCRL